MEMTAAQSATAAARIVAGLKKAGIDFVATLPDEKMLEVIRAVESDNELKHVKKGVRSSIESLLYLL